MHAFMSWFFERRLQVRVFLITFCEKCLWCRLNHWLFPPSNFCGWECSAAVVDHGVSVCVLTVYVVIRVSCLIIPFGVTSCLKQITWNPTFQRGMSVYLYQLILFTRFKWVGCFLCSQALPFYWSQYGVNLSYIVGGGRGVKKASSESRYEHRVGIRSYNHKDVPHGFALRGHRS